MEDLALHILDVAENSTRASASLIEICVVEDEGADLLTVEIFDDGDGMAAEVLSKAGDPFFTTKAGRRIGLGIPMFAQAARDADGELKVEARPGGGTRVVATFRHGHLDRKPIGDLRRTMAILSCSHPEVDFACEHVRNGRQVRRSDTRQTVRADLTERDG